MEREAVQLVEQELRALREKRWQSLGENEAKMATKSSIFGPPTSPPLPQRLSQRSLAFPRDRTVRKMENAFRSVRSRVHALNAIKSTSMRRPEPVAPSRAGPNSLSSPVHAATPAAEEQVPRLITQPSVGLNSAPTIQSAPTPQSQIPSRKPAEVHATPKAQLVAEVEARPTRASLRPAEVLTVRPASVQIPASPPGRIGTIRTMPAPLRLTLRSAFGLASLLFVTLLVISAASGAQPSDAARFDAARFDAARFDAARPRMKTTQQQLLTPRRRLIMLLPQRLTALARHASAAAVEGVTRRWWPTALALRVAWAGFAWACPHAAHSVTSNWGKRIYPLMTSTLSRAVPPSAIATQLAHVAPAGLAAGNGAHAARAGMANGRRVLMAAATAAISTSLGRRGLAVPPPPARLPMSNALTVKVAERAAPAAVAKAPELVLRWANRHGVPRTLRLRLYR